MYWLHWKSEKNRTEPNELDELKYSKSLNQMTSYAYWHAFLYFHAHIKCLLIPLKKTELNELNEYSTGIKELVIRREAISLQLQGYEIWNFSVVCTYSTPTPHKGLELFRAIFVFGCQKKFFSKNCYCRLKNLFQKLSFMLDIGNAKSYKFHFLKNIFRQFLRERH